MTLVCGSNDSCESRGDLALFGTPHTLAAILEFLDLLLEGSARLLALQIQHGFGHAGSSSRSLLCSFLLGSLFNMVQPYTLALCSERDQEGHSS